MLCDVVRRRRWAHAPVIHAASHFYHKKRVAWVSIPMHACDPVPIVMGLWMAALRATGAPLKIETVQNVPIQRGTNMAAGNQQKHRPPSFASKA